MGKELIIALYDTDVEYIKNFTEYCMEKENFSLICFTDEDNLYEFCSQNIQINIILIAQYCFNSKLGEFLGDKAIIFTNDNRIEKIDKYRTIYKFQSIEIIICNILNLCAEENESNILYNSNNKSNVLGIFSPVNRCGKTTFVLELSKYLCEDKILVINFESFSALMENLEIEEGLNISDLIYFFVKGNGCFDTKMDAIIRSSNGVDIIPPTKCVEDLKNISGNVWIQFINLIKEVKDYDLIILDLANLNIDIVDMLDVCDKIFMPTLDDNISNIKVNRFYEYLMATNNLEILEKIMKINMEEILTLGYEEFFSKQEWVNGRKYTF